MEIYIADTIYLEKIYLPAIVSSVINYYPDWVPANDLNFDVLFIMIEAKFASTQIRLDGNVYILILRPPG